MTGAKKGTASVGRSAQAPLSEHGDSSGLRGESFFGVEVDENTENAAPRPPVVIASRPPPPPPWSSELVKYLFLVFVISILLKRPVGLSAFLPDVSLLLYILN